MSAFRAKADIAPFPSYWCRCFADAGIWASEAAESHNFWKFPVNSLLAEKWGAGGNPHCGATHAYLRCYVSPSRRKQTRRTDADDFFSDRKTRLVARRRCLRAFPQARAWGMPKEQALTANPARPPGKLRELGRFFW